MRGLRYLWLLFPGLGLLELGAQLWLSRRAPSLEAWRGLAATALSLKRPGEPVVVAPEWAEPLARLALGDRIFPVAELARSDDRTVPRLLEISELGARAEASRDWKVVKESREGPFVLRELENPRPLRARYDFVDHVGPGELTVSVVSARGERGCEHTEHARVTAGGLHGQVAFPAERFQCPGGEPMFVGVTIIDDESYRPRRCIWAHPPLEGVLRLKFANVPLGTRLRGFAGLSYFLFRDGVGPPITLRASSGGELLGSTTHRDETGFVGFEFSTAKLSGRTLDVELEVESKRAMRRDFCFSAESVE